MNKERVLKLAQYLEVEPEKYDQRCYFHEFVGPPPDTSVFDCNTPGCIAGHTVFLFATAEEKEYINRDVRMKSMRVNEVAQRALEISYSQRIELFDIDPLNSGWDTLISAEVAVRTLRHFAETGGEVFWKNG